MRHYETKQVPATTKQELVKVTCDLCGAEAKKGDWRSSIYEVNEVELRVAVRQKDGRAYPDGDGWGTKFEVDMCPDCFKTKLIPWLESQGCKAERKEWEW